MGLLLRWRGYALDTERRFREAIQHYWDARQKQKAKQVKKGVIDTGTRGAVTGGTQMGAMEVLVTDILCDAGLDTQDIRTRTALELPGYFRSEKKWDLLVVSKGHLIAAIEFKSQVGPSFGNNFNNRTEEAIGSATDVWTAYREGRLGSGPRPLLGYFFLLEDCENIHKSVRNEEPYFQVDPVFKGSSYAKRYEMLCKRLLLERLYDAACLVLGTNDKNTRITQPSVDLSFKRFAAELRGHVAKIVNT